jgi:glucose-1-phosphatase
MQHIKAIIFDFGGVIFNIDFNKTCLAFNDLGIKGFADMYSLKDADPLFQDLEKGKFSGEEFYSEFRKCTGSALEINQIDTALNALLLSYRKEALQTLTAIRPKYKLYLLSNTNSIHLQAFTKMYKEQVGEGALEDFFDKVYYSHETGYRKPAKEAYEIVLKENDLSPAETLFIDDSLKNIEGAQAVGLQTIFLKEGMGIEDLGL